MAEINDPGFLQNGSHLAQMMNLQMESLVPRGGVVDKSGGDLLVSEKSGTPDMSVDVAAGAAYVPGDETSTQGVYFCHNDAVVNLTITAADSTDDRHDLIVAQVEDSQYSGATDDWSLAVVTGTAAASPSDPAVDSNSITLARVVVPAAASSIVDADIADLRDQAGFRAGGLREVVRFTSSGTFTKGDYPWLRAVVVHVQGGGGAGRGTPDSTSGNNRVGGSGTAGGYVSGFIEESDLSTSETVTVGTGGTGVVATDGNDGGDSSFGSFLTGTGGSGSTVALADDSAAALGDGSASLQGGGAVAAGATTSIVSRRGGVPGPMLRLSATECRSPNGGESHLGPGASGRDTHGDGRDCPNFGGGGSGGVSINAAGSTTGGDGADGVVVVELYG